VTYGLLALWCMYLPRCGCVCGCVCLWVCLGVGVCAFPLSFLCLRFDFLGHFIGASLFLCH